MVEKKQIKFEKLDTSKTHPKNKKNGDNIYLIRQPIQQFGQEIA